MDPFRWITTTEGRLAPKPFALGVLGVYVASIASQELLSGGIIVRAGLTPFLVSQAALIWIWLLLHIRRLRDAGKGPASAVGVAIVYALAIGLLMMLVAFFTNPDGGTSTGNEAGDAAAATLLVLFLIAIVFKPDFGVFTMILKGLIVIAFLPVIISLLFSIHTGLRKRLP